MTSSTERARALVLGGIRSGKSRFAETLVTELAGTDAVRYLATGGAGRDDPAWRARVSAHRDRRPHGWQTVENSDVAEVLRDGAGTPTLVDDIGGWLTAVYDRRGWQRPVGHPDPAVAELLAAVEGFGAPLVLVSPEVGLHLVPATESGRLFADALGETNQRLAAVCDRVDLVVAGVAVPIKGAR